MEISNKTNLKKPAAPEDVCMRVLDVIGPVASVLLAALPIALHFYNQQPQKLPISATFTKNNQTIQLEVARKPSELYKGLKFRESIPTNRGMLFVVNRAEPIRLWMEDTYIPLDMVFMRDGIVNQVVKNAVPCSAKPCPLYGGKLPTNQIIEIPAGKASKLGIEVGDRINIKFKKVPVN